MFKGYLILHILVSFTAMKAMAQQLQVTYGSDWGIHKLSYQNEVLLDLASNKGRAFGPEAYKSITKDGKVVTEWSRFLRRGWNGDLKTFYGQFNWGQYECKFSQVKDTLFMEITFRNYSKTDTFCGMSFSPLALQLARRPANFQPHFPYYGENISKPATIFADTEKFRLVVEQKEPNKQAYIGMLEESGSNGTMYKVWSGNRPYTGMQKFNEDVELRIPPGQSYSYTIALKFTKPGTSLATASPQVLTNFRKSSPSKMSWRDRRPIGTLFLSSFQPNRSTTMPRNWKFTRRPVNGSWDKATLAIVRKDLQTYATNSIKILKDMNAQGMITWDIEGQEYPHPLSYIGSPELLARLAPEMEVLADEYFERFRTAGFKTGICIRPDSVIFKQKNNWIDHVAVQDPAAILIRKINYAKKRWGCTIFYIDSNIEPNGEAMNAEIFKKVQAAVPDVLLIPEHERLNYFAFTAPYGELRAGTLLISEEIKSVYPESFMTLMVPDGLSGNRNNDINNLKRAINQGSILLFRAWYEDQPTNSVIKAATKAAGTKY